MKLLMLRLFRLAVIGGACLLAAPWDLAASSAQSAPSASPVNSANLLRNGSFEGGRRYWFETEADPLVQGNAADGDYSLKVPKGVIQSAAFLLAPDRPVTLSFSAKAVAPTTMGWQITPAAREIGVERGETWGLKAKHPLAVGTSWKRFSATFTPHGPQTGFWPRPTYMVQLGDADQPLYLDAVTVAYGAGAGVDGYLPWRPIEAQLETPDLPGYTAPSGNTFGKGATVRLVGSAYNPGNSTRRVTFQWRVMDYEGVKPITAPVERIVTLPPGHTITQTVPMKLSATGMVLTRFSVLENGRILDRSDLPLASLPYPKAATRPDSRERFGASYFGPHSAQLAARLGMAWSRWYPHTKWQDSQPTPDTFHWFDRELDRLESLGISADLVLYGWPKWIMDEGGNPLPRDMRWPAGDPRWDDLTVKTAWDRYIVASVEHYRNRSVIFEIENEPEFDRWDNYQDEYARFTTRTARLIKQTAPNAIVMVDNVYSVPSGLNERWLRRDHGRYVDVISWHDYHEGGLSTGADIQRMRARLKALGASHLQIWFNEGWAYTNTAVDEPAVALTHLNAAQSANAMVSSLAELTVAGQDKTILFHTGYEEHGMSFWDYAGPGTMLWDYYNYPTPLVGAWNTLIHHIGLSEPVAWVRPPGASLCIFQDLRNGRGVCIAYADSAVTADVSLALPVANVVAEDIMGNARPLKGKTLFLPKNGRPVFLYTTDKASGKAWAAELGPLDRQRVGFVSENGALFRLPYTWSGGAEGKTEGNPALWGKRPVWRLDQVWPPDPMNPANYHPLLWREAWWKPASDGSGDQPKAELTESGVRMEFRAATGTPPAERIAGLTFIAPKTGKFTVRGSALLKLWDGDTAVRLTLLKKTDDAVKEIASTPLTRDRATPLPPLMVTLNAGEELVLLPRPQGSAIGGDVTLQGLTIRATGVSLGVLKKSEVKPKSALMLTGVRK